MEKLTTFRDKTPIPPVIYNSDSDDYTLPASGMCNYLWSVVGKEKFRIPPLHSFEDYLSLRLGELDGTDVPALSYCGNFGQPIWEVDAKNVAELGDDVYAQVLQWWKSRAGRVFYFSMRMNDLHHNFLNLPHLWPEFRKKTVSWFIGPPSEEDWRDKWLPWIEGKTARTWPRDPLFGYDYAKPEIRAYYLGVLEEALTRYDLDGVELDWLRSPRFFKPEEIAPEIMNDFVGDVYRLVSRFSGLRGHSIRILCRVPRTPEAALRVGLDVLKWLENSWIDALIVGNGGEFSNNPIAEWIRPAHALGTPVYACIERINYLRSLRYGTPETLRAAAATLWQLGADGLYLFNYYKPAEYPLIDSLSDPDKLAALPKEYFINKAENDAGPHANDNLLIPPGGRTELSLVIADDPAAVKSFCMELRWEGAKDAPEVLVNGVSVGAFEDPLEYSEADQSDVFLNCAVCQNSESLRSALKKGNNLLTLRAKNLTKILSVNLKAEV